MATYNRDKDYGGDATILVTQVKASTHAKPKTRGTVRALGLRRVGDSNVLPDRPEIRGMIARVPHLVEVGEAGAEPSKKPTKGRAKSASASKAGKAGAKKQEQ